MIDPGFSVLRTLAITFGFWCSYNVRGWGRPHGGLGSAKVSF